jgi:hypothetical protein
MLASKVSRMTLEWAAEIIGVTAEITTLNTRGTRHRVKLLPSTHGNLYRPRTASRPARSRRWPDERGDTKYQRQSPSNDERRVHAVCWHGFRDYFRAVFIIEPDASFRTALATWKGSADFEARFRDSGHHNIGSQAFPVTAAEACRCPEAGSVTELLPFSRRLAPVPVVDDYGASEADGAACRAMSAALAAIEKERKGA